MRPSSLRNGDGSQTTILRIVLIAGGPFDAVILSVAASDIHHVSSVRLANCNSRVRADCDTELFLSRLPESLADALDSTRGRNAAAVDCGVTVRRWRGIRPPSRLPPTRLPLRWTSRCYGGSHRVSWPSGGIRTRQLSLDSKLTDSNALPCMPGNAVAHCTLLHARPSLPVTATTRSSLLSAKYNEGHEPI
jgi:hypothetical protein